MNLKIKFENNSICISTNEKEFIYKEPTIIYEIVDNSAILKYIGNFNEANLMFKKFVNSFSGKIFGSTRLTKKDNISKIKDMLSTCIVPNELIESNKST